MRCRFLLSTLICLLVARESSADSPCSDWTDKIDDLLFEPVREIIRENNISYYPLPDLKKSFGSALLTTSKGVVGDLTSFKLKEYPGVTSAVMCEIDDKAQSKSNLTVALIIELEDVQIRFQDLSIKFPVLPVIGDCPTYIKNTGNGLSLSLSVRTTAYSDCIVDLNYLQIIDLGETSVHFEAGKWSIFDRIYQIVFNLFNFIALWFLKLFGTMQQVENQFADLAVNIINENKDQLCEILTTV